MRTDWITIQFEVRSNGITNGHLIPLKMTVKQAVDEWEDQMNGIDEDIEVCSPVEINVE